ncbi:MAG: radical SAM protein, partial [Candidatus Colwellbacteria bacterium]|nr:radical SAM protein [Candidatus Colwellbacteria bacterium]
MAVRQLPDAILAVFLAVARSLLVAFRRVTLMQVVIVEMRVALPLFHKKPDYDVSIGARHFSLNDIVGLSQFVRLRKENTKITVAYLPHLTLKYGVIRPEEAVILCLFDGWRSLEEVIIAASIIGDMSYEEAQNSVLGLMNKVSPDATMFIKCTGENHRHNFDARNFFISPNKVDLTTRLDAPLALVLQPTPICEANCVYCYACRREGNPAEQLSFNRICELLDEANTIGIYQVNLCGGDGFCRSDFVKIIKACLERNLIVDISTKCEVSSEIARELASMGLDYIQVSIDTYDEKTADYLYGKTGHFKKVVQTIRNLLSAGVYTRTNSIVTPYNYDHIKQTIEFLKSLGIREMKFAPAFRSSFRDNLKCLLSFEQKSHFRKMMAEIEVEYARQGVTIFHEAMKDYTEMTPEEKKEYWFQKRAFCSSGRSSMIVAFDGNVILCEESPQEPEYFVGNVKTQSIKDIWDSRRILHFIYPSRWRFAYTPCYSC